MRCLHYRAMEGPYARDEHNRKFVAHICGNQKLCGKYSKVPKGDATAENATIESNIECCNGPIKGFGKCAVAGAMKNGLKLSLAALTAYYTFI